MIQGCIIFYNDTPRLLERALVSLKKHTDYIVGVDGVFNGFPYDKPYSTDGCLDVAKEYCDKVIECESAWKDQVEKRNQYLTLSSEKDYYFVLDSDEYGQGNLQVFGDTAYAIDLKVPYNNTCIKDIRLFQHRERIKYNGRHSWVYVDNKIINQADYNSDYSLLKGFEIIHTPDLRDKFRLINDALYMEQRKEPVKPMNIQPDYNDAKIPVLFKGKKYSGYDKDGTKIKVETFDKLFITRECATELLANFPDQWELL